MISAIKKHLIESKTQYKQHFIFAVIAAFQLLWAGICSIIHAFFPNLFPGTAAKTVIKLYHRRLVNHPNKIYQEYIQHEIDKQKHNPS